MNTPANKTSSLHLPMQNRFDRCSWSQGETYSVSFSSPCPHLPSPPNSIKLALIQFSTRLPTPPVSTSHPLQGNFIEANWPIVPHIYSMWKETRTLEGNPHIQRECMQTLNRQHSIPGLKLKLKAGVWSCLAATLPAASLWYSLKLQALMTLIWDEL